MDATQNPTTSAHITIEDNAETTPNADEYEEKIMLLKLNGVLDFEAVKRAANMGAIRVREAGTETPLVQVGSSLYSGEWTMTTLGTDLLFCVGDEAARMRARQQDPNAAQDEKPQLSFVSVSDTRLMAKKVLLATEEAVSEQGRQEVKR